MESSHLVIFSTSGKFITKCNVLRIIGLSETIFWTGARVRIPITLTSALRCAEVNKLSPVGFYGIRRSKSLMGAIVDHR